MSETVLGDTWLDTVLKADATIAAACGTRVYEGLAPESAAYPFIVWQSQDNTDLRTMDQTRIWNDSTIVVRAVAKTNTYSTLSSLAAAIDSVLHKGSGTVTGGVVIGAMRLSEYRMTEDVSDGQIRHLGGRYRLIVQGT